MHSSRAASPAWPNGGWPRSCDRAIASVRSSLRPELAGDGPADLGDFERVRQPGAVVVVGLGDEHLRLVHEPAKGGGVDDAVAVALVERAIRMRRLGVPAAAALPRVHRVRGQDLVLAVEPIRR